MTAIWHKWMLFLVLVLALVATAAAGLKEQTLDIYWVDVEGGGGTLIVTPAGESALVDIGLPGERDSGRIHRVAAEVAGLDHIDHLITTHFDPDHYGGAADLAKLMPIHDLWDNGIPDKDPAGRNDARFLERVKPYREMPVGKRHLIAPGDVLPLKQSDHAATARVTLRCLAARQQFIQESVDGTTNANTVCGPAPEKSRAIDDNANSAVLLLSFGRFRFFDAADLLWDFEKQLVCPINRVGEVDVFQATHHGLDASNHPFLIQSLAPTVSVMVNGPIKGCGPATFATLRSTVSIQAMYQLHKNLRSDGENNTADECIANLEKDCQANYIKVSVAADGRSYVVSIPGKNYERIFQTKRR